MSGVLVIDILNAVLAFASYMVILSTIVSAIVEYIFQLINRRQNYFNEVISRLFDDIIWCRLKPDLQQQFDDISQSDARVEFLKVMTSVTGLQANQENQTKKEEQAKKDEQDQAKHNPQKTLELACSWFCKFWNSEFWTTEKKTERLTSIEFASRFAKTRSGKIIYRMGEKKARIIVSDLIRSFEDLSVGSTSDFRVRARKWSLWVGLALVLAFNIDAFQLFKQLSTNSKLAEQVISVTSKPLKEMQESGTINKEYVEKLNKTIAGIDGLPVGWNNFPRCSQSQIDVRCPPRYVHDWILWILGIGSAAIFVGLGSPFWFQVFQRLSVAAQLVSGFTSSKNQPANESDPTSNVVPRVSLPYQEAVEAFMLAAKAEAILPSDESKSGT